MKYHSAIIGAGSGGLTVAVGLAGLAKRVVIIEKKHVGGDCTNVGCIPSKLLIHYANQGNLTPVEIFEMVRQKRNHLRDEEDKWIREQENIDFVKGEAKFIGQSSLQVDSDDGSRVIEAENIIIASGSSPIIIPIKGLAKERVLSNESLFDLEDLPKHLAIVGAGVIGCEMAFAFNKLGAKVSLIDLAPRILSLLEPEVAKLISTKLLEQGVEIYVGAKGREYIETDNTLVLDKNGTEISLKNVDNRMLPCYHVQHNVNAHKHHIK